MGRLFLLLLASLHLAALAVRMLADALSATIANRTADYYCRAVTPTALTSPIKISLHTGDPGTTGANEVTGGSYARQSAGYSAASGGACALAGTVSFTGMPAVTVTHMGLWDSAGTPLFVQGAALLASKPVGAGDTLNITSATDTITGA